MKVFCWTGGGILPVCWRVLSQMVSIHCGDGFTTLRGWFYPNSGMVLSQLWEGVFFQLWGVFFSKVFFQLWEGVFFQLWGVFFFNPRLVFFPTQHGFFSNPRWVFFQPKVVFFPTQGRFFSSIRMIFFEHGGAIF